MEEKEQFLIFAFLNDNHLSNVKTLQSIYKQDYENIFLILCNDCTDAFQCERFLYNLEAGKGKNIKGVYLHENHYPIGEYKTQKKLWRLTDAEYVITLHSGEYFSAENILRRCAEIMEEDITVAAVCMEVELWSDDMKRCIQKYDSFTKPSRICKTEQIAFRDSMFVYRKSIMEKILFQYCTEHLEQKRILELLREGYNISVQKFSCCKYSLASIRNTETLIPKILGNERIQNIYTKLHGVTEK